MKVKRFVYYRTIRYNCELVKGKLTKEQEVLVEMARELCD